MHYRDPQPITQEELDLVIKQGIPEQICAALVDGAYSITDFEWLEDRFLALLHYDNIEVQGAAITCIGHLARLHGKINLTNVSAALLAVFQEKPVLRGRIGDTVDDIRVFMKTDLKVPPG